MLIQLSSEQESRAEDFQGGRLTKKVSRFDDNQIQIVKLPLEFQNEFDELKNMKAKTLEAFYLKKTSKWDSKC